MSERHSIKTGAGIILLHFICSRIAAGKEGTMRNWKSWFKAAGIRALKTFCQTAVAMLPASAMINEVGWATVFSTAALASIASLLTSLAGIPEEELE